MNQAIREIIKVFNPTILNKLDNALKLHVTNFKRDLFPSLKEIDLLIPGVGFQYVIWIDHEPKFPFLGWDFDAIARPMRYIPTYLASGIGFVNISRAVALNSGGHVEECVKAYCTKITPTVDGYEWMPIGRLARNSVLVESLGTELTKSLSDFTNVLVNKAKHEYRFGSPGPVIPFPDALGGYFASRILGFQILDKGGILDDYIKAIRKAYSERICYTMPSGSDPGDDEHGWPLQSDLKEFDEDSENY